MFLYSNSNHWNSLFGYELGSSNTDMTTKFFIRKSSKIKISCLTCKCITLLQSVLNDIYLTCQCSVKIIVITTSLHIRNLYWKFSLMFMRTLLILNIKYLATMSPVYIVHSQVKASLKQRYFMSMYISGRVKRWDSEQTNQMLDWFVHNSFELQSILHIVITVT